MKCFIDIRSHKVSEIIRRKQIQRQSLQLKDKVFFNLDGCYAESMREPTNPRQSSANFITEQLRLVDSGGGVNAEPGSCEDAVGCSKTKRSHFEHNCLSVSSKI